MASLSYLNKYLNKDPKPGRKRKRDPDVSILEDGATTWTDNPGFQLSEKKAQSRTRDESVESCVTAPVVQTRLPNFLSKNEQQRRSSIEADKLESTSQCHETVYRDATGRRLDIVLLRQEKARKYQREQERKAKELDLSKGLVQEREKETTRSNLERIKGQGFSRYAGSQEQERYLMDRTRDNDPAASFLSTSHIRLNAHPLLPKYEGDFAPNRYSIQPGYRWDGVDRGNNFERRLFQRRAEVTARKVEAHNWSVEDM